MKKITKYKFDMDSIFEKDILENINWIVNNSHGVAGIESAAVKKIISGDEFTLEDIRLAATTIQHSINRQREFLKTDLPNFIKTRTAFIKTAEETNIKIYALIHELQTR